MEVVFLDKPSPSDFLGRIILPMDSNENIGKTKNPQHQVVGV